MKVLRRALAATFAFALSVHADAPWANAEHLLYVRIETEPAGATVRSVPEKEGLEATVLGKTPLVVPVEMNWDRKYLRKRWELLRLTTRGGIATNRYDATTKEHVVLLNFALEKEGYTPQVAQEVAGVFQYDDHAEDWDHAIGQLAERRTLKLDLVPEAVAAPAAAAVAPAPAPIPTVIIARGGDAPASGYVIVEGRAGETVVCNGIRAGHVPLRIMLPAGEHTLQALQDGKPAGAQTIKVTAGRTETLTLPASGQGR